MERKAENVVQNIGAVAETISIFYNSISKQVPKDVALILTQHFMDLTIVHRPAGNVSPAALAAAIQAAEAQKRTRQHRPAPQKPETPPEAKEPPEAGDKAPEQPNS